MNARRMMYLGIAAVGITSLGAYAYFAQRMPLKPVEQTASGSTAPASTGSTVAAAPKTNGGSGGSGSNGGKPNANAAPAAVDVIRVGTANLVDDISSVGTLRSNESVVLRPEVAGRITRLNFNDGATVKKGQVLVAFDAAVNQAEVQQAKAELSIARANFARNEDLARQNFISARAKDESASNVQVLEAKLALAQAKLSKLEIRAPFSGIVGIRTVSVGDYVKDGAELINLEDISSVKVDFRIPEKYSDMVKNGQALEVQVDALPGKAYRAQVDAIDPQVDSSGRSALLRGKIDNADGRLKPGMFARVRLILAERTGSLVVPEEAIVPKGGTPTVWRVVDGRAKQVEVKIGLRRSARVEILEGLRAGDLIVTAGQVRLSRNDVPVRIAAGNNESNVAAAPAAPPALPAAPTSRN